MKRMLTNERGNVVLLMALSLMLLLAMAGIVIDGGSLYVARAQLQKAANAAALSGAQELTGASNDVERIARETLHFHHEETSLDLLDIQMEDQVSVGLTRTVPLGFSGILGVDDVPVSVAATAELGVIGEAMGAAPLGIDESIPLVYNQEYRLKVDSSGVDTGNFGVLALGGPGAATYEDNLRFGYGDSIGIGDILETQTGNIAGKTRRSVKERITNCPYPPGEMFHRDCPRILLVPVYRPYNQTSNQLKEVEVTGFSYFYITEPMSSHDTSITGKFIKRAGTGFIKAEAVDRGALAIRLTE